MKKKISTPKCKKNYTQLYFFSLFLSFVLSSCSRDDVTGNKLPESSANNNGYKTYGDLVLQKKCNRPE